MKNKKKAPEKEDQEEKARINDTLREVQEKINAEGLNEVRGEKEELECQNEEDRAIINDENTTPSEKKTVAEERVAQREEEIRQLTTHE